MYKTKLQELCQRRSWDLPEYATAKDGPDHMPRFTATVTVCGQLFNTPDHCKSSKDAQNTAARVAFDHFSTPAATSSDPFPPPHDVAARPQMQPLSVAADPPHPLPLSPLPSSLPNPTPGFLVTKYNTKSEEELLQENCDNTSPCPIDYKAAVGSENKDTLPMYKNLLQQHAQKESIGLPVYTPEAVGPPHARRFKSKVSINGKSYEPAEFFPTLKEAEQTAAKIACLALSLNDKGFYKNLLQVLAQKKGLMCPSYETVSSGLSHKKIFVSTVEVGSDSFQGLEAKTRKQAEMNAAEVAYSALTKGGTPTNSIKVSSVNSYPSADILNIQPTATTEKRQNIQHTATTEKHQVAIDEDGPLNAKRAKSSLGDVDVNAHLHNNPPSHDSKLDSSTPAAPAHDPTAENQPRWMTVVRPSKSNWQKPENATVLPYSNEQWVAYRVEVDQKPSS
ncbi:HLA class II histocompatibility antigen, DR beta 4 chain, variant 2 [Salvia divinorum]|uniref:HLA class II histocompatibility antigen, DR beta 4 chain, variant 2 n=1 Tax=Salvia divinorum TaxID=28513 RepID=A0ABD1GP91_SALDI